MHSQCLEQQGASEQHISYQKLLSSQTGGNEAVKTGLYPRPPNSSAPKHFTSVQPTGFLFCNLQNRVPSLVSVFSSLVFFSLFTIVFG